VISRDTKVGSDLTADLSSPDFTIVRVGEDDGKRTLATGNFAEWQWNVQPLRSGQRILSLILYVRLEYAGAPLEVKAFDEQIEVQVNPIYTVSQWVENYWQETGLTVPVIVGAIWAVVAYRRRHEATLATPGGESTDSAPSGGGRPTRNRSSRRSHSSRRRRPS